MSLNDNDSSTPIDGEVRRRLASVETRVAQACAAAGRSRTDVQLVAVSKLQGLAKIQEAFEAGQVDFAENYAQEFSEKWIVWFQDRVRWHFIGHLQRNKTRLVVPKAHLIHSVDSLILAEHINAQAIRQGSVQKILLEVNLAAEPSKPGFTPELLKAELSTLASLRGVRLHGLMGMPPLTDDPETSRPYFRRLCELRDKLRPLLDPEAAALFTELSMGTSQDFPQAIAEGATLIRIGTDIFGERPFKERSPG